MLGFLVALRKLLATVVTSLKQTLTDVAGALRARSGSRLAAVVTEGSPLESLVDSALTLVFWALVVAPFLLVPVLYLLMSVAR